MPGDGPHLPVRPRLYYRVVRIARFFGGAVLLSSFAGSVRSTFFVVFARRAAASGFARFFATAGAPALFTGFGLGRGSRSLFAASNLASDALGATRR